MPLVRIIYPMAILSRNVEFLYRGRTKVLQRISQTVSLVPTLSSDSIPLVEIPNICYIASGPKSVLMKTNSRRLMNAANYRVGNPIARKAMAANYLQITPCMESRLWGE